MGAISLAENYGSSNLLARGGCDAARLRTLAIVNTGQEPGSQRLQPVAHAADV